MVITSRQAGGLKLRQTKADSTNVDTNEARWKGNEGSWKGTGVQVRSCRVIEHNMQTTEVQ